MTFARNGFGTWLGGLPRHLVADAGDGIREFFASDVGTTDLETDLRPTDRGLERVFDIQAAVPTTTRLWTDTELLQYAARLIEVESVRVFYTQAILKHSVPAADRAPGHGIVG